MSEIDGPKFSVNSVNFSSVSKAKAEIPAEPTGEEDVQINDFSNSKAEALGRSMLFKGNDSLENDLKALKTNPQIAENSDEIFEVAYNSALKEGLENPYEVASTASTTAI